MRQRSNLDPKKVETAKLTVAMGSTVKEAAESLGLPYEAIRKRAQREKWPSSSRVNREAEKIITAQTTTALAESVAERGSRYEENISQAGLRMSETVARLDGTELLKRSRDIAALDSVARKALGLDKAEQDRNAINIAILGEFDPSTSEPSFYKNRKPILASNSVGITL